MTGRRRTASERQALRLLGRPDDEETPEPVEPTVTERQAAHLLGRPLPPWPPEAA